MNVIAPNERIILGAALATTIVSAVLHFTQVGGAVIPFLVAAAGLASLAAVVGEATDHLGARRYYCIRRRINLA